MDKFVRFDSFKKIFFNFDVDSENWVEVSSKNYDHDTSVSLYFDVEYSEWFLFDKPTNTFLDFDYFPAGYISKNDLLLMSRFDSSSEQFLVFDEYDLYWKSPSSAELDFLKLNYSNSSKYSFDGLVWFEYSNVNSEWLPTSYLPDYWYVGNLIIDLNNDCNYRFDQNTGQLYFYQKKYELWEEVKVGGRTLLDSDRYLLFDNDFSVWFRKDGVGIFVELPPVPNRSDLVSECEISDNFYRLDSLSGKTFFFDIKTSTWVEHACGVSCVSGHVSNCDKHWLFDKDLDI